MFSSFVVCTYHSFNELAILMNNVASQERFLDLPSQELFLILTPIPSLARSIFFPYSSSAAAGYLGRLPWQSWSRFFMPREVQLRWCDAPSDIVLFFFFEFRV